jgi:Fe-S-cluster containining protein
MYDFDTLLWQVSHQNIQLYKDDNAWYLLVNNRCNHLLEDGRCNIYDNRPQICREHSTEDCEFDGPAGSDDFDMFFPEYESLLTYCKKRFKNWDQRFKKGH